VPVDPDVNTRNAGSRSIPGNGTGFGSGAAINSANSNFSFSHPAHTTGVLPNSSRSDAVAGSSRPSFGSVCSKMRRSPSGFICGCKITAMAPICATAKNISTVSIWFSVTITTRSPRPTPLASSHAAMLITRRRVSA
jgi:hypothetical protein